MNTLAKMSPPDWLTAVFKEIDEKTFGSSFDVLTSSTHFQFGTGNWHGRDEIVANLKKFDSEMDTHHTIFDFWDGGEFKFFTGSIQMAFYDGRPSLKSVISHVIHMQQGSIDKIDRWLGAAGPANV